MTDLERLWDDVPVGPPPTSAILRAGRAAGPAARRRRLLRPLTALGAVGALAASYWVGGQLEGPLTPVPPGSGGPVADGSADPVTFQGELVAASSCEDLLDHYVDRAAELVGPYGWDHPHVLYHRAFDASRDVFPVNGYVELSAQAPTAQRAESSETGTNVQEAGVDEPDVVKTDGERLYRIDDDELTAYDVTGRRVERLGSLLLDDLEDGELLLADDTLVAVGRDGRGSRATTVDVSDPETMEVTGTARFSAEMVTARQHGTAIRVVLGSDLPQLDFVQPDYRRKHRTTVQEALRENRRIIRETTIADWLPTGSVDGAEAERLSDCDQVAVPRDEITLGTTTVVGFDARDLPAWDVTAVAADASTTYASEEHLYLATTAGSPVRQDSEEAGTTHVFDFELAGTGTSYVGAGEVDGFVQDRWAVDESDGVLRLAVSPSQRTGNFNSVVTLRRAGDRLEEVGRLDGLGPNETIESVRWFDDLAIVVTFRQVDPLYTVDLSDPTTPTLLGKLKIPGFSEYLHPLGSQRMVGIGRGPDANGRWGAQAGLFAVADLTRPRRLSVVGYGPGSRARAGADPRQLTWLPETRQVLTVVTRGRTGYVSVLDVKDGELRNRMVVAEYGVEAKEVRLVPLPGGRVVLLTGEGAEFFPLR